MLDSLIDSYGEPALLAALGLVVGLVFGAAAQQSRFCLRAATVEVSDGQLGGRMAVWLLVFFTALTAVQGAIRAGWLDVSSARQLAATGSLSGAMIGGVLFGVGMILARGCASRLLVLSGTGNMRALVAGLVVTLVAQASYRGVLAPVREAVAGLWTVPGGTARDLMSMIGVGQFGGLTLGLAGLAFALALAARRRIGAWQGIAAILVGLAVAVGWLGTWAIAAVSFEIIPVASVTFTGPATDTLMALVAERSVPLSFGIGLVPGVFAGSAIAALIAGDWRLERFGPDTPMERYLVGAVMMGFGAMLAGGCAVGAGVSGGAILSLTAWVAVASMWAGALAIQWALRIGSLTAAA